MIDRLAGKVDKLERVHFETLTLLGQIVSTMTLPRNMELLNTNEAGKALVELSKVWYSRFQKLEKESSEI